ncbi:MAG TPA: hypothetical protein DHW17_03785 [Nitrospina sp.]|nr:hypothetical protein [Nitrospina sp.]
MSVKKPPPTWENFCRELIFILYSRLLVKKKAAKECLDAPESNYEVVIVNSFLMSLLIALILIRRSFTIQIV